jgi:hypothetical protein
MSITCWVLFGSRSITVAAGTAKGGTLRAWARVCGSSSTREEHNTDAERLEDELRKINRSLRAQTLRLEEHEDPNHPIVALASERIVELSTRKAAVTDALETLKAKLPAGHHPDEILAMLDALPDPANESDRPKSDRSESDRPRGRSQDCVSIPPPLCR